MKITEIKINDGRRSLDQEKVKELAESIKEIGLLNPITITENNTLIAGRHRIEAYKLLGLTDIKVNVVSITGLKAELAEIDENLMRNDLHFVKRGEQLARRKEIYEELYPETKAGGSKPLITNTSETAKLAVSLPTFTEDVSKKVGTSQRTIKREIQTARDLTPKAKEIVIESDLNKGEALTLSRQDVITQNKVVEKVKEKEANNESFKSITSVIKEVKKEEQIEERKEALKETTEVNTNYTLTNESCLDMLSNLENKSIDCVVTDPPYAIDFNHSWQGTTIKNDDTETALNLLDETCKLLVDKCKEDAHIYIFSGWVMIDKFKVIIEKYFDISNLLVWVKNNTSLVDFDKRYGFKYENIFFCKQKGNSTRVLNSKSSPDVLEFSRVNSPNHPTEKPVKLLEYLINNSTIEGETVCDPFTGSGSTGEASLNNNRLFIGSEIDKKHFEYAESRLAR